ncbi:GerAB/ArcD/ProY family transporter [Pseudobacteroides cellulosolvens]|uniref:Spore germination protein n=1 Tax=Pseudobacteroides cellulosolvens ATCC 35603 = DSM 2933 TaxID=398512 RepID=A0A0L6JSZ9_9FIRM|nr:GerAB/ArcD/ProY family transporter [Pseudobacteroides cellulosolvens]KNY28819.1 Spore germination protein [Pseudobacteroides cellulosolvens ATCC 35603 = DSM 2933]
MEKKIVFGNWEVVTILINVICTKIFLNYPRMATEQGGTAGWIFTIYVSLLAFLGFYIIQRLYKPMEGKDLIDIGEHVGGGTIRILVGVTVMFFLIYVTTVYLRTFSENMKLVALTNSPLSFVELFFLVCMVAGAYFGLEAIARLHAIAVPAIAIGFLIILVGVSNYVDFSQLLPIMGEGAYKIFGDGAMKVSIFAELLLLFLMAPYIRTNKNFKVSGFWALGFSSFFLFISALIFITVLPVPLALERTIPIFHLARLINYGRFFQRIESVFIIIWAAASLLFVTVNFYFILHTFKKTFKLEYYKPLILPFAILIMTISFLPDNLVDAVKLEVNYFRNWAWTVTFGMTIILLLIARARKKKHGKA